MLGFTRLALLLLLAVLACAPSRGIAQASISDAQLDGLAKMYRDARTKYEALVKKADEGDVESQFVLGAALYDQGIPGVARDQARGMKYLEMAAAKGNAEALAALGLAYEQGRAVKQDYIRASDLYVQAGRKGNWRAQFLNIRLVKEQSRSRDTESMGALELPEDAVTAFNWYLANIKSGDIWIMTNLGRAYAAGSGTERNPLMGMIYSAGAAKRGSDPAKSNATRLLPEFPRLTTKQTLSLFSDASSASQVDAKIPKGRKLAVVHQQDDGWTLVVDPVSYDMGYVQQAALKSATVITAATGSVGGKFKWPARPAAVKGATRCNTQCKNGDCYRTYSDGRKVHFQAKQVWDSVNNTFVWDSGGC